MIRSLLQTVAFAITLAVAAVIGLVLAIGGASYALGGTITGTAEYYDSPVRLMGSDDFAVWGGTSLAASAVKGTGLIDYTLTGVGAGESSLASGNYAAVFGTGTSWTPGGIYWTGNQNGKGFTLTVPGDAMEGRTLGVWVFTNGPAGGRLIASGVGFDGSPVGMAPIPIEPYRQTLLLLSATGLESGLSVTLTSTSSVSSAAGQFVLGAAALTPLAVPEPEYWLAGLIVLMGMLAYWLFMSTVGRIIRDGDGDRRDP